jgi:nitroimidazol reductase NimA-like FMN-containing flavoprotein (pyridoxamine 5'-phosphate oxidase superfamily)
MEEEARREPTAGRPFMPGYGLAERGDGLLPWSWAVERLARTRNYWLSTTTSDAAPHSMPVWGVWTNDRLFFSTGRRSRKYRNLVLDARCVVTTGDGDEPVVVQGTAREVGSTAERERFAAIADAYRAKYDFDMTTMNEPLFELRPVVVFGMIEQADQFSASATRWVFDA